MMKIEEYQALAMRTSPEGHDRMLNGCLGLIGESGEVVDVVKKWKFQSGRNAELPKDKLIDECGDVLWYCAEFCQGFEIELERVINEHRDICLDDEIMISHDPTFWAYKISSYCHKIYQACYGLDGSFDQPRAYFSPGSGDGFGLGPIATPAELKRIGEHSLHYYCTFAYIIAHIVMITQKFLEKFANSSLEEAMERNIEKQKKRYPDGFDPERSLHRAE